MFNKKKNILLYVLIFIMVFSIDVKRVRGFGWSAAPAANGGTPRCDGESCVQYATTGVRLAVVDDAGNVYGKVIDYNFFSEEDYNNPVTNFYYPNTNNSLFYKFGGIPIFFKDKKLKQDLKNSDINNLQFNSEYFFNPIVTNDDDTFSFILSDAISTWCGNKPCTPEKNVRSLKYSYTFVEKIKNELSKLPEASELGKKAIQKILNDTNSHLNVNSLRKKYYIQVEPLMAYENSYKYPYNTVQQLQGKKVPYNFYGTISEFIFFQIKTGRDCYNSGTIVPRNVSSPYRDGAYPPFNESFKSNTCTGAINYGIGIYANDSSYMPNIFNACSGNDCENPSYDKLKKFYTEQNKDSYGVGFISLETLINEENCNDDAHQRNSTKPEINNYSYNELIAYLKKNWSEFNNTYNPAKNKMNVLRAVKENNIKSHINNNYFNTNFEDNYCGQITCANILDNMEKNESNLKWLYNIFNYNELLNPETLKSLYEGESNPLSYAQCKPTPECPLGNKVIAKCNSDGAIVFEDNSSLECLSDNNIAYNGYTDESGTFKSGGLQSSKAPAGFGKDSFCWEQVTLTLPKDVANTKAGNLLKWGTDLNDSNVYGTMQITKRCFNVTAESIKLSWLKETATNATLNYKEAILASVPADKYTAQIRKGNVISKINKYGYRTYSTSLNRKSVKDIPMGNYTYPGMDNINKNVSMNSSNSIDVVATYDLVYPDELNWYTNKDKNSSRETISKKELDASTLSNNNNYNYLGYGFPTSFLTPTGLKKNENWNDSVSVSGNDGTGYMYAEITNVGTKNNNNSSYHFDKMIKYAVEDDSNSNAAKTSIIYSCGYSIYNELFGYEDGEECVDCPTPKGIDVVFRTVELINGNANIEEQIDRAFPGKAGRGRERGSNWTVNKSTGDNYTNDDIASILSSDVYNNEPMYSISLDSALIQEIRNSNRDIRNTTAPDGTNLDPYTYMGTNNEYGYTKGLIEEPDKDTDESSLKYFYISNWLTRLSENHHDRFTINNDLENRKNEYIRNYAQYNRDRVSSLLPSIFR